MFELIKVSSITVPEGRLRKPDKEAVQELAISIKETGLLQPIIVRRETSGKKFRLIAGGHRLDAHKLLGRDEIAAEVRIADDTRIAELADIIAEIDENVRRNGLTEGEVKLHTKRRRDAYVEKSALEREAEAQEAHDKALIEGGREEKRRTQDKLKKAKNARQPTGKHTSSKAGTHSAREGGKVNKAAAGEFNRDTAKAHGVTERAVKMRVQQADEIERIAEWASVDARDIARSSIQSGRQLEAAIEIVDKYGSGTVVDAGNVHKLLKQHVRRAAKGDAIDLISFKKAVDSELRKGELSAKRDAEETERLRHAASILSKAAKAVLDAQDLLSAYKLKPKNVTRLDQIKRELRSMADQMKSDKAVMS
jgi:ParB/RepB/Spo0J family partition protein